MACNGLALALRSTATGARNKVLTLADKLFKRIAAGIQAARNQLQQQQRHRPGGQRHTAAGVIDEQAALQGSLCLVLPACSRLSCTSLMISIEEMRC